MSIPLKAKRDFSYAMRRVRKGQDFDAQSADDARFLKEAGYAKDRPVEVEAPTYRTRMMTAEPPARETQAPQFVTKDEPAADQLETLDADALHELAKARGIYVHHRAGADRVRQILREAQQESSEE